MPQKIAPSHPIDLTVGTTIRLRRHRLGLSQGELASMIGVTFQQVQKYEQGRNRVACSKLYEIARALEVSPGYFFPLGETTESNDTLLFVQNNVHLIETLAKFPQPVRDALLAQAEALLCLACPSAGNGRP